MDKYTDQVPLLLFHLKSLQRWHNVKIQQTGRNSSMMASRASVSSKRICHATSTFFLFFPTSFPLHFVQTPRSWVRRGWSSTAQTAEDPDAENERSSSVVPPPWQQEWSSQHKSIHPCKGRECTCKHVASYVPYLAPAFREAWRGSTTPAPGGFYDGSFFRLVKQKEK